MAVVSPLPAFADPGGTAFEPVPVWERASGIVEEYLWVSGRPEQPAARRGTAPRRRGHRVNQPRESRS
ncbi:hypothetical protein [Streptomyces sp. NPDC008092]|uniref:hypothetical protein n=1 Tax=Streptomyces sp. NPDC008092 TaxID=3364808 RepID=UPI0036E2A42B